MIEGLGEIPDSPNPNFVDTLSTVYFGLFPNALLIPRPDCRGERIMKSLPRRIDGGRTWMGGAVALAALGGQSVGKKGLKVDANFWTLRGGEVSIWFRPLRHC